MFVRRTVAALVGAALLLAGCSDDPEPRFAPPSESPSPSESATSAEPEPQSPEEFIREWVELDRQMQNSGETEAYLAVSSTCDPCREVATQVAQIYARGGHIDTEGWSIDRVSLESDASRYRIEGSASPVTIVERAGASQTRLEAGPITYELLLERMGDSWHVVDLLEVAS